MLFSKLSYGLLESIQSQPRKTALRTLLPNLTGTNNGKTIYQLVAKIVLGKLKYYIGFPLRLKLASQASDRTYELNASDIYLLVRGQLHLCLQPFFHFQNGQALTRWSE